MFNSKIAVWIGLFSIVVSALESAHAQGEVIEQWAREAIGVSSGNNQVAGGREQLKGPADSSCELYVDEDLNINEDYDQWAWRPGTPDGGAEWVEVWFGQSVFATAIEIHQSLNPGAITRVQVRDLEDQLHEVWAGEDPSRTCPAVLRIDFEPLEMATNPVRIELNTALIPGWNQIDAVKLIGTPAPGLEPVFIRLGEEANGSAPKQGEVTFNGQSFTDVDNDGWGDIIGKGKEAIRYMLHNEGDGSFHYRGPLLPLSTDQGSLALWGGGPAAGDYDNDGDLDLFYPAGVITPPGIPQRNRLLRNDRGHFVEVGLEAGFTDEWISPLALWFDYNRDGFLDIYVGNWTFLPGFEDHQNLLYHNNGDGTFRDVTATAGLDVAWHGPDSPFSGGTAFGFTAADFNDDGWPDLYVPVSESPNRLFFNDEGVFREATTQETGVLGGSFGSVAGDIDNDGDLDLFAATTARLTAGAEESVLPERSTLFLNLGAGEFIDVTDNVGLQRFSAAAARFGEFIDFDNDMDVDLFSSIGEPTFFENNGDLFFIERRFQTGIAEIGHVADYDGDGFLDMIAFRHIYRNRGNENHYLAIDLVGVESNRDGIGARVFATAGEVRQMREFIHSNGWTQDEFKLHFGLGEHTMVDQVEVRWPSGQVDVIDNIPADQTVRIIEGRGQWYAAERTVWETPPPNRVDFGQSLDLQAVVRPALFEPTATVTSVTADLSGLGGPDAVPLVDQQDGTYLLEAEFVVGGMAVLRDVEVLILQQTSLGEHWIRLTRGIEVSGDPNTAIVETFTASLPESFTLGQNYPNPFNSGTVIRFELPASQEVELSVYNMSGQKVATLVQGVRAAGSYAVHWDGADAAGRSLASGMYVYRLAGSEGPVETRKLLLLR